MDYTSAFEKRVQLNSGKISEYSNTYEEDFNQIPEYQRMPFNRPWVGDRYENSNKKILIIGYRPILKPYNAPNEAGIRSIAVNTCRNWYSYNYTNIDPTFFDDLDTARTIGLMKWINPKKHIDMSYQIYWYTAYSIEKAWRTPLAYAFRDISYMHFCSRPIVGRYADPINSTDASYAQKVIPDVISILNPDKVIYTFEEIFDPSLGYKHTSNVPNAVINSIVGASTANIQPSLSNLWPFFDLQKLESELKN